MNTSLGKNVGTLTLLDFLSHVDKEKTGLLIRNGWEYRHPIHNGGRVTLEFYNHESKASFKHVFDIQEGIDSFLTFKEEAEHLSLLLKTIPDYLETALHKLETAKSKLDNIVYMIQREDILSFMEEEKHYDAVALNIRKGFTCMDELKIYVMNSEFQIKRDDYRKNRTKSRGE